MTSDLIEFGKAVRLARTAKGMTLEMLAHEALGNQERKSYVSAVEKGRKRLSALTFQKFANCLELDADLVARLVTGASDEDEPVTQTEVNADAISKELEELRQHLKVSETRALSLAFEFAEGNPTDLSSALNELRRAFEVSAKKPTTGNLDQDLQEIIAEVRQLNEDDKDEEASLRLDEALEAELAEEDRRAAGIEALIREGIDQAILMRDVEKAAALVVRQVARDVPDPTRQFPALSSEIENWLDRGRDKGLAFDLEVSIGLSQQLLNISNTEDERGASLVWNGIALQTLGERESGTDRLEQAVTAYRAALEEYTRDRVPLDWAMTQNNLGNALRSLGERESGTARLEEAVVAYRAALEEYTRDRVPLDWAMTQNNLGGALQRLGERESGTARLEEAVAAYRAALEERTRDRVPLDWAMTQNNLGGALQTLGQRERGTARLEEAVAAHRAALEERTRERVPFQWAMTTLNLGLVYETLFDKMEDRAQLEEAIALVRAAREVFDEAGASFYIEKSDRILADMEAKL